MKALLTLSMVLGTVLMLGQPAQAGWLFGNDCCCQSRCCQPTCSTCCSSSGWFGYHGGGVWW
ncbi:MAG TPA: hypothetical protein VMW10_10265 [Alphaproteobacteria bacterium]|nr:hypothetical protein [Alphaproteobacteria bacterium]